MLKRTAGLLRPASGDGRDALQNFQDLRGQRAVFHVQNFLRVILDEHRVVADQQDRPVIDVV